KATAEGAVVLGGEFNEARGNWSLAAGLRARAMHQGSFVWADPDLINFTSFGSTAENQFLIRASGGVGVGTNSPMAPLDVAGRARMTEVQITGNGPAPGKVLTSDASGVGSWQFNAGPS